MQETNETLNLIIGNLETAITKMEHSEGFATSTAFGACAAIFSQYAKMHQAKGTAEGDAEAEQNLKIRDLLLKALLLAMRDDGLRIGLFTGLK